MCLIKHAIKVLQAEVLNAYIFQNDSMSMMWKSAGIFMILSDHVCYMALRILLSLSTDPNNSSAND
jgi:hypothetical protein